MKTLVMAVAVTMLMSCSANRADNVVMIAGTYTDSGSEGLYSFVFNQETGESHLLDSCRIANPSYLTIAENGKSIYTVSELHDDQAAVYSVNFDASNGCFEIVNSQLTQGADPCYVATNGKVVVTANYGGSTSVFQINGTGELAPLQALYEGGTGGPDLSRQKEPHVHCTEFDNNGRYLYVSDFSADRLLVYEVSDNGCKIEPMIGENGEQAAIPVAADYGPRHIIFDQSGNHAYVIGELSGMITVFDVKDGGMLVSKQTIEADTLKARGSADIHLSRDGRYLYASNRLKGDGIAIYNVDDNTGELTKSGYMNTGLHPRNFNITPNGKFLLCACRDSDCIEIYRINEENGLLTDTGKRIALSKPVCIKFVK